MKHLLLIGASGHGKVVAETAELCDYSNIKFLDITYPKRTQNGLWSIVGEPKADIIEKTKNSDLFISIGNNRIREQVSDNLNLKNCPIIAHPSAVISRHAKIDQGSLLVAGSVINIDAEIGKFVIVNTGASIDHDCNIGDFVHISPGARLAGGVSIGVRTWIGIGAVVKENIKIGKDVIIGAGAAVVDDVPDGATVLGVPATPYKDN